MERWQTLAAVPPDGSGSGLDTGLYRRVVLCLAESVCESQSRFALLSATLWAVFLARAGWLFELDRDRWLPNTL